MDPSSLTNTCTCIVIGYYNGGDSETKDTSIYDICIPCHDYCKTCTGSLETNCITCFEIDPIYRILIGSSCPCQERYY